MTWENFAYVNKKKRPFSTYSYVVIRDRNFINFHIVLNGKSPFLLLQERAFWDVYRPPPGCINTTELDIKKVCRMNKYSSSDKMQDPRYG